MIYQALRGTHHRTCLPISRLAPSQAAGYGSFEHKGDRLACAACECSPLWRVFLGGHPMAGGNLRDRRSARSFSSRSKYALMRKSKVSNGGEPPAPRVANFCACKTVGAGARWRIPMRMTAPRIVSHLPPASRRRALMWLVARPTDERLALTLAGARFA